MMELADMRDLGSRVVRRAGSTPVTRTTSSQAVYRLRRFFMLCIKNTVRSLRCSSFPNRTRSAGFDLVPVKSKHRSVSALRRKQHYVSSFFLTNSSLWETGSDYLFCPLSAQPKPGAAVRARECRKVFFRTMQRCFFRTTALLEIEGGQTLLVPARLYGF